jgi:hypothetical protein
VAARRRRRFGAAEPDPVRQPLPFRARLDARPDGRRAAAAVRPRSRG